MTLSSASPILLDSAVPLDFSRAKTAKAAGHHDQAVRLLARVIKEDPGFEPAARMLKVIEAYPVEAFTYSRVIDFIYSKGWGIYDCFFTTEQLIARFNLKTGIELGVSQGFHAQHLLEAFSNLDLVGVDVYRHVRKGDGYDHISDQQFEDTCRKARGYLVPTGRWRLMRMTTTEAAKIFRGSVDFLYVDADHSYESARDDIRTWFPFVRPGGIVAGHDYGQPLWPGVQNAVDEVLGEMGLKATTGRGTVWWAQKPV
ncbi:MAG TPA: class I SAM-dependent methyltransferase [Phycisphaerae bacterium]